VFIPAPFRSDPQAGIRLESVVLLDEAGYASGTADKAAVHHDRTPLHLAFSCYLFDEAGQFLLTRRAESKRTFPGVWTNTCCGHPQPGEPMAGGVLRRLRDELGIGAARLELILPGFRYQATMASGLMENELCPVYAAYASPSPFSPDPAEVAETRWVNWEDFCEAVRSGRQPVSPWCAMQLAELAALGPKPLDWVPADPAGLPPAALG
jgi:isopentenyl-diphosphate delta-isomerase